MTGRRSRSAVQPRSMFDRIERDPHAGITDRVDVDLEPIGVERAHRFFQALRSPVGQAACMWCVLVWLEEKSGPGLDHTIGEELDGPRGQPARRRAVGHESLLGFEKPRPLQRPRHGIGLERCIDSACQQPAASAVGVDVELVEPDDGVLAPHDALRAQSMHRLEQPTLAGRPADGRHVGFDQLHRAMLQEHAGRATITVTHDHTERRIGRRRREVADGERSAVGPQRVIVGRVEHHRPITAHPVEPLGPAHTTAAEAGARSNGRRSRGRQGVSRPIAERDR